MMQRRSCSGSDPVEAAAAVRSAALHPSAQSKAEGGSLASPGWAPPTPVPSGVQPRLIVPHRLTVSARGLRRINTGGNIKRQLRR